MRRLAWTCFVAFWACVLTLLAVGWLAPESPTSAATDTVRTISEEELATHDSLEDCWMAIRGKVYDLTQYIPEHPTPPAVMVQWCGREATEAYDTKGYGRPHSPMADAALDRYLVGRYE